MPRKTHVARQNFDFAGASAFCMTLFESLRHIHLSLRRFAMFKCDIESSSVFDLEQYW